MKVGYNQLMKWMIIPRVLIILAASMYLAAPAQACLIYDWQRSLLQGPVNEGVKANQIIGYGITSSEGEWIAVDDLVSDRGAPPPPDRQRIKLRITKSDLYPALEGREIWVRYNETSCGPFPRIGQAGFLVGKILETDEKGFPTEVRAYPQAYEDKVSFVRQVPSSQADE